MPKQRIWTAKLCNRAVNRAKSIAFTFEEKKKWKIALYFKSIMTLYYALVVSF